MNHAVPLLLGLCLIHAPAVAASNSSMISHPHSGEIYSQQGEPLSQEALLDEMAAADVVFLGELHDNPDHHVLQGAIIQAMVDRGRRPAIGLEMIAVGDSSNALAYTLTPAAEEDAKQARREAQVRQALSWQDDFTWDHYSPLLHQAQSLQLPLFGIDQPKAIRQRISQLGLAGLTPLERGQIPTTGFADDDYRAYMEQEFKAAHCGWGPSEHLAKLYDNWVARNDTMAHAIAAIASDPANRPVLVILGKGHNRYGMGPVLGLKTLAPELEVMNLAMVEARADTQPARELRGDDEAFGQPYELVWFTRTLAERPDHCAHFLHGREQSRQ